MENKIDVKKIAAQNDKFRKTFEGGKVLLTCGVSALPLMQQQEIMQKVRTFNNFTEDNDPYNEHETSLSFAREERPQQRLVVRASRKRQLGEKIFWKIDYYDKDYRYLSENPCNPNITNRVMTIMLSYEY